MMKVTRKVQLPVQKLDGKDSMSRWYDERSTLVIKVDVLAHLDLFCTRYR
jgi:hypothetical protein